MEVGPVTDVDLLQDAQMLDPNRPRKATSTVLQGLFPNYREVPRQGRGSLSRQPASGRAKQFFGYQYL